MKVLLFVTQTQFYMLSLIFGNFHDDVDNRQFSWWVNIFTSQCSTSPTSSILSGLFRLWFWSATLHRERETEDSDRWLWSWRTSFPFSNWETGKLWNENLVVSQIWLFRSFFSFAHFVLSQTSTNWGWKIALQTILTQIGAHNSAAPNSYK